VFGGGQLGRMFVHAAQRMGYRVRVYSSHAGSPAGRVADEEHVGPLTDLRSVAAFAQSVAAATLEFENVPTESVAAAERLAPVRPGSHVLHKTQHRVREKTFLAEIGAPVGPFAPVGSLAELRDAAARIGLPAVLKTAQMGYDGKGQRVLRDTAELDAAWEALGPGDCVLEAFVDFTREVSMLVARGVDGDVRLYGPIENDHANHILDVSVLPAPQTSAETAREAERIATLVATRLDSVGLICVEMFQRADGALLVNEIAPRPHNSGHLTIDTFVSCQFEQQVRAVCGLPLGSAEPLTGGAAMANLLGDLWSAGEPRWDRLLAEQAVKLHLYGKAAARPGRKMGHLTAGGPSGAAAAEKVRAARRRIYEPKL